MYLFLFSFFFKQKTAYEMRISDWSSDVGSSDLLLYRNRDFDGAAAACLNTAATWLQLPSNTAFRAKTGWIYPQALTPMVILSRKSRYRPGNACPCAQIGRASCRERVCKYV